VCFDNIINRSFKFRFNSQLIKNALKSGVPAVTVAFAMPGQ